MKPLMAPGVERVLLPSVVETFVELRLPQATAASMLAIFTFLEIGETPSLAVVAVITGATLHLYCLDSLLDRRPLGKELELPRYALLGLTLTGGVTLLVATSQLPLRGVLLVAIGLLPCALYAVPFARHRLKDVVVIKMLLVPGAIVTAVVGLPAVVAGATVLQSLPIALALLPLVAANVIASDLRDLNRDLDCGICTLPQKIGRVTARRLATLLALIGTLLSIFLLAPGSGIGCALAFIGLRKGMQEGLPRSVRTILIDGALVMPSLALLMAKTLTER